MFLIKFFKFLKGYVIIKIYGHDTERFLNICVRRNISIGKPISDKNGAYTMSLSIADFYRLGDTPRKTGVKVKIIEKCGLPFLWKRIRKRYVFFAGFLLTAVFVGIMSSYVWTVEVDGASRVSEQAVIEACRRAGVYPGVKKRDMQSVTEIKNVIMTDIPDISWAWVYIEGVKARVSVRESILPPEIIDKSVPCNIVAGCDALIKKIIVKDGEAMASPGDAVLRGEVVISAVMKAGKDDMGEPLWSEKPVHAMGEVLATTWHTAKAEYPMYHESRMPTGEKKTRFTLELFSKQIPLYFDKDAFDDFDIKTERHELSVLGNFLGIAVTSEEISEVNVYREPLSYDSAVELAKYDLEEKISKELMSGAVLEKEDVQAKQINNETVEVSVEMQFTQNIGVEAALE